MVDIYIWYPTTSQFLSSCEKIKVNCTTLYFSKLGAKPLKCLVMGASTLHKFHLACALYRLSQIVHVTL